MNHSSPAMPGAAADAALLSRSDPVPVADAGRRPSAIVVVAAVVLLLFVLEALLRRLNFDESLALRGGWLALEGLPASPPFAMPVTLLLGAVARVVVDSGWLFLVLRTLVVASVLGTLFWAFWRVFADPRKVAAAVLFTLAAQSFGIHAYEFRYDWGILVGTLVAFAALLGPLGGPPARRDWVLLGAALGWCASHHLKGVGFAAAIAAVAALQACRLRCWRGLFLAVSAALGWVALWVGGCHLAGLTGELGGVYATFAEVAGDWRQSGPSFAALGAALRADLAWWLVAALAVASRVGRSWRAPAAAATAGDAAFWALPFALLALLSLLFHPHPWPYMLVPAVPFLAIMMADTSCRMPARRRWLLAPLLIGAVATQWLVDGSWPLRFHGRALGASRTEQVQVLRDLRQLAEAGDRIVDPSGMAWFLPPCSEEWYVDTLFVPRVRAGRWMADGRGLRAPECRWVLVSYRFDLLPEAWRLQLHGSFALLGEALALRTEPPPTAEQRAEIDRVHGPHRGLVIESFW